MHGVRFVLFLATVTVSVWHAVDCRRPAPEDVPAGRSGVFDASREAGTPLPRIEPTAPTTPTFSEPDAGGLAIETFSRFGDVDNGHRETRTTYVTRDGGVRWTLQLRRSNCLDPANACEAG